MHCSIPLVAILLIVLISPANVAGQSQTSSPPAPPPPCETFPEHQQFDFWVGTWNVEDTKGNAVGKNVIERLEGGCLLMENWTGRRGGTGKSINFYDATARKWRQTWVSSTGNVNEYQGEFKDGAMRFEGKLSGRGTNAGALLRLTFIPLGSDKVRQFSESSADGGKTWQVNYDFLYVRRKSAN